MSIGNAVSGAGTDGPTGLTGLACKQCGGQLDETSCGQTETGALNTHVWCPDCGAGGCLTLNKPGRKTGIKRGRALRGDRQ